jgi:hypothetical protein
LERLGALTDPAVPPTRRRIIVRAILGASVAALLAALAFSRAPALTDDFMAYWSAARLLAGGADPYDPAALLAIQQSAGWRHAMPLPTWYGPWIIAATAPIGLIPYWPARAAWMIVQVACLLASAAILWRLYGGAAQSRRPYVLAATFAPSILGLVEGQITHLILLALACFLLQVKARRDWLAGAVLFPLTAKPLTLYLIGLTVFVWALRARRPRILGGLLLSVAAGSIAAWLLRGAVFSEWMTFAATYSPLTQRYTPTVGSLLRSFFGPERLWLAYPSAVIGLLWWGTTWRRYGGGMDWLEQLPTLSLISLLTAPFAWSHDAVLLLPAVFQVAAVGWSRGDAALWILLNTISVGLYPLLRYRQTGYLLYPLSVLFWRRSRKP